MGQGSRSEDQGSREKLRVAVVGAGAFGRNHLRVYRELEQAGLPVELAAVVDPDEGARSRAEADFGVRGFATIEECMGAARDPTHDDGAVTNGAPAIPPKQSVDGAPDPEEGPITAASVCVPTVHHAECARALMAAGVDLLIEKPLAASLEDADEIAGLARELRSGGAGRASGAVQSGGAGGARAAEPADVF